MTVCIAAKSQGMLLLISDRMITANDIEFEPPSTKVVELTSSISMMYSGDATFYAEVGQSLLIDVRGRIEADAENWLKVRDVANLWVKHWTEAKYRHAEAAVLFPFGLDRKSFVEKFATLEPKLAEKIADDLSGFRVPGVEVIIAGIDLRFGNPYPSIYQICDDTIMCADQMSFAVIGTGARHAESQFMLAKYAGTYPNGEALLLAYSAKRNAEVAPGVGSETDVSVLGPNVGVTFALPDSIKAKLEAEYQKIRAADERARQAGRIEISKFLDELGKAAVTQAQEPTASAGTAISVTGSDVGSSGT